MLNSTLYCQQINQEKLEMKLSDSPFFLPLKYFEKYTFKLLHCFAHKQIPKRFPYINNMVKENLWGIFLFSGIDLRFTCIDNKCFQPLAWNKNPLGLLWTRIFAKWQNYPLDRADLIPEQE